MFDPVLTLETAGLMLVAFLVGATVGALLRLAVRKLSRPETPNGAVAPIEEKATMPDLVTAPVIAPMPARPSPVAPDNVPVPDFVTAFAANLETAEASAPPPAPQLAPARRAGETASGRHIRRPEGLASVALTHMPNEAEPDLYTKIDERADIALPSEPGRTPQLQPVPQTSAALPLSDSEQQSAPLDPGLPPEPVVEPPPAPEPPAEPFVAVADAPEPEPDPVAAAPDDFAAAEPDESAAMRAIEGSWTPSAPRRRRAEPPEPAQPVPPPPMAGDGVAAAEPELAAEKAFGAIGQNERHPGSESVVETTAASEPETATSNKPPPAETTAAAAPPATVDTNPSETPSRPATNAEASPPPPPVAPAPSGVAPAQHQPPGIGAPRHGMRDDLTQIVGVLPVAETVLNRVGIYHYDQLAEWTDEHVHWVETHLGVPGRVAREQWREQARELAATASGGKRRRKRQS